MAEEKKSVVSDEMRTLINAGSLVAGAVVLAKVIEYVIAL